MKSCLKWIAVPVVLAAQPAKSELLTHHDLPYATALTIAHAAVESCAAKGYAESAVVVDRAGETIVAIRGDNAGPHTLENARRKAYTAMSFRVSTTDYAKRFADNNPVVRQQVTLPNVIAIPGGLPIIETAWAILDISPRSEDRRCLTDLP